MNKIDKEEYFDNLRYFWEEKQDIERYIDYDIEIMKEYFPEILSAWINYKDAIVIINSMFNKEE